MTNRYPGRCYYCGGTVEAHAGRCWKKGRRWLVAHLDCADDLKARVNVFRFSSGKEFIRNSAGRCEDAPCCGCCTI